MVNQSDITLILVAGIGACGALGVAVVNTFGIRKSRHAADIAAEKAELAVQQMDTGNEKKLGATVHDMAQTVEIIAAQVHTDTNELFHISKKLDDHVAAEHP